MKSKVRQHMRNITVLYFKLAIKTHGPSAFQLNRSDLSKIIIQCTIFLSSIIITINLFQFHEKEFVLRTKESYNIQADQVQKYGEHFSKTYGINRKSILTESNYYHVVDGLPPDIMHDILEGVLQYETKEMLKNFIKVEHYLTLKILNDRIAKYDFGYYNDTNKPSPITEAKFSSNDNSLKQHG